MIPAAARWLGVAFALGCHHDAPHVVQLPASPTPKATAPHSPPPELGELLHGCANATARVARVGASTVLVVVHAVDGKPRVTLFDVATTAPRELAVEPLADEGASAIDTLDVSGASIDDMTITLVGNCAPELEEDEQPVRCRRTLLQVHGTRAVVSATRVLTGDKMARRWHPAPAAWQPSYVAWKRTAGKCDLTDWTELSPSYAWVRVPFNKECSFGAAAIVHRTPGALEVAVGQGDDGTLALFDVGGARVVGHGVDGRIDTLARVDDDALTDLSMPGAASPVIAVGETIWASVVSDGVYQRSESTWHRVSGCSNDGVVSLEALGPRRVAIGCNDGSLRILDAESRSVILSLGPHKDRTWTAFAVGNAEVALVDDEGAVMLSHYAGPSWTCNAVARLVRPAHE